MSERPRVDFDELACRGARRADREALEALSCGDEVYEREVERFVRHDALPRHLNAGHPRHHRLLVFESPDGEFVAAAAHRPAEIPFPPATEGRERGTSLVVAAIDVAYQGHDLPSGHSLARRMMELLLADVASRSPGRLVAATAHIANARSLRLCSHFGLDPVQQQGDYVQLLGSLPAP